MESIGKPGGPDRPLVVREEAVHVGKPGVKLMQDYWLADTVLAGLLTNDARSGKRVRAVTILVQHGEAWVVDRKGGNEFQVAVDTSPVTRQWAAAQLCDPVFGHPCHECTGHPYAEAVLTRVDHCDTGPCVVIVFGGWDDAELLIGMTSADRDLTDAES